MTVGDIHFREVSSIAIVEKKFDIISDFLAMTILQHPGVYLKTIKKFLMFIAVGLENTL